MDEESQLVSEHMQDIQSVLGDEHQLWDCRRTWEQTCRSHTETKLMDFPPLFLFPAHAWLQFPSLQPSRDRTEAQGFFSAVKPSHWLLIAEWKRGLSLTTQYPDRDLASYDIQYTVARLLLD